MFLFQREARCTFINPKGDVISHHVQYIVTGCVACVVDISNPSPRQRNVRGAVKCILPKLRHYSVMRAAKYALKNPKPKPNFFPTKHDLSYKEEASL